MLATSAAPPSRETDDPSPRKPKCLSPRPFLRWNDPVTCISPEHGECWDEAPQSRHEAVSIVPVPRIPVPDLALSPSLPTAIRFRCVSLV